LFEPYQRRDGWIEQAIISMYQNGMSTREIGKFVEKILGHSYSATTISNITEAAIEDIQAWQERPLQKRYSVLYLDGLYLKLRRDTVGSEVIYLALGITEEGHREILGFYVGGKESALGWRDMLLDLYSRGAQEVLLGIFDGLAGLEEAFHDVYPKADVQRCVVHKVRNTLSHVRKKDQPEIANDLKTIYKASTHTAALEQFQQFEQKWKSKYPKEVQSWEKDLPVLLTFLNYPSLSKV
jgi:putative transposase